MVIDTYVELISDVLWGWGGYNDEHDKRGEKEHAVTLDFIVDFL